jgi:hypothetical protein
VAETLVKTAKIDFVKNLCHRKGREINPTHPNVDGQKPVSHQSVIKAQNVFPEVKVKTTAGKGAENGTRHILQEPVLEPGLQVALRVNSRRFNTTQRFLEVNTSIIK